MVVVTCGVRMRYGSGGGTYSVVGKGNSDLYGVLTLY